MNIERQAIFEAMLLNDLHLEYEDTVVSEFPVLVPILILAGDIGRPDCPFLQKERLEQLQQLDHLHPRIHFLQNQTYLLSNRICLLGTTLWSSVRPEAVVNAIRIIKSFLLESRSNLAMRKSRHRVLLLLMIRINGTVMNISG